MASGPLICPATRAGDGRHHRPRSGSARSGADGGATSATGGACAAPLCRARFDDPDPARREGPARIPARTLAIAGGAASPVPQERIAELARQMPDCRLVTIEAGHPVHSARPAEFVAAVAPFLEPEGRPVRRTAVVTFSSVGLRV